jgi:putative transposase
MMSYASNVTDKQWQIIEPLITYQGHCRPRKYNLREILNGIFYALRSGCQWRMLPRDFPPWKSVYDHYYRWRLNGTWDRVHDILRDKVRVKAGKSATPTVAIVDSRSVKSAQKGGLEVMTEARKSKVVSTI